MSHVPSTLVDTSPWPAEPLSRRLLDAARSQGQPGDLVLLRVPAPLVVPEALLQRFSDRDCVLWSPPEGPQFAGIDVAASISARGPQRFAEVRRRSGELWRRLRSGPTERGALESARLFGGFAFSDDGAEEGGWASFGAARFVLPRISYARQRQQACLTLAIERSELDRGIASEPVQLFQRVYQTSLSEPQLSAGRGALAISRTESERVAFERSVDDAVRRIQSGELQKVVAAREVQLSFETVLDSVATVIALREQAPECVRFLFQWGDASFVGATPELLVRTRQRRLETEALAGTIDADAESPEHRLQASAKELEEHQLVVSAISSALAPVCERSISTERPRVRRLKHLLHLSTPIQAQLRVDTHVLDLVERLHPTPAVGGVPTREALDWIRSAERFDRGWYSGAVGWFDAEGDGEFNVALRSGLIRSHQASLYAGAGIVRESTASAEYNETTLKLAAVLGALRSRP
jgi:menaquinone-specific isochorismate synthase